MTETKFEHFHTADKLHTDVLAEKYGLISAVVLRHDDVRNSKLGEDRIREAKLVDSNGVLRTYALTFLTYDKENQEIYEIDYEIRRGGLLGQTFRKYGYTIKKNVVDVFIIQIPVWMQDDFKTEDREAKARIAEFYTKKENLTPVIYGIVLEVYAPDFRNPKDGINDVDTAQINPLIGTLQNVGVPTDEIWSRLDKASEKSEWNDLKDKYEQAKELSKPIIKSLHKKIEQYLSQR